jgi:hypothetical protein
MYNDPTVVDDILVRDGPVEERESTTDADRMALGTTEPRGDWAHMPTSTTIP